MPRQTSSTIDYGYAAIVAGLLVFGLLMLASAGAPSGFTRFHDSYYFVKHQLVFGLIPGLIALFFFLRVPYDFWRRQAWPLLLASLVLLILVFIPGISAGIGSAHSWISIGGWFSLQPSEIVKLTFLFYLAAWLEAKQKGGSMQQGFGSFVAVLGLILLLLMLQPDIGTLSIISAMALSVYFFAGAPILQVLGLLGIGAGGLTLLIGLAPYRAARFTTFLHPELDPQGVGYHINQALLAIGSGGWFGLGYGHSRQKFQFLPEVTNDSIYAVIAEEWGFFVAVALIAVFLLFFWRSMKIAKEAPDMFGRCVVLGVGSWVLVQAFVNIGSMLSLMPITGLPLPFISYGGTSLAINLAAVGVVLNISKYRNQTSPV
ncbi:putative lipid II flippase FtsW [Candidatus Uhrbacteria bacterium]|nr:putative lipid II flippase FtsW [Candidatus Uhrbacteria bacterium]